jgi:hypothetical protein
MHLVIVSELNGLFQIRSTFWDANQCRANSIRGINFSILLRLADRFWLTFDLDNNMFLFGQWDFAHGADSDDTIWRRQMRRSDPKLAPPIEYPTIVKGSTIFLTPKPRERRVPDQIRRSSYLHSPRVSLRSDCLGMSVLLKMLMQLRV